MHRNIQEFADPRSRAAFRERENPYWSALTDYRHIGYQKRRGGRWWVARFRTTDNTYIQSRLGAADDLIPANGVSVLTLDQAIERASRWFSEPDVISKAKAPGRVSTSNQLLICPIGDEFTIGHALQDYLSWKRLVATKGHFLTVVTLCNAHIVPRLISLPVRDLTPEVVRAFIQDILETPPKKGNRPLGPKRPIDQIDEESLRKRKKTVNTVLTYIRHALRMAWEAEKIDSDKVWRRIGRFQRVDRPRALHLSRSECKKLLEHCRWDLRLLVLGALYTGCRVTELRRLKCSDVGRDGYGIYIEPAKTRRGRFVFLPDEAMNWFLELTRDRPPSHLVFTMRTGNGWREKNYSILFREAVRSARLPPDFTFHGLRHTYASQLIQAGTPVFAVADQLGHINPTSVLRTYGHLSPQIRESEVRQRFTTIDPENAKAALVNQKSLRNWRKKLHGGDWRTYAQITDLTSRANTE